MVVPPAPGPLRAGFGRVVSITPIPVATPLAVDDRVEITTDGKMRHPVP